MTFRNFLILLYFTLPYENIFASIYQAADYKHTRSGRFHIELDNLPKIKNQKNAGLCYGFTAVTMLEYHKCKVLKLDCTNLDLNKQFSALDVTAGMNKGKIKEGGVSNRIFENMSRKLRVASEKCAPYSQLEVDMEFMYSDKPKQSWQRNASRGLDVLENFYVKL